MSFQDMVTGAVKSHFQHDDDAVKHAVDHDSSANSQLFETALSFLQNHGSNENDEIDEDHMVKSHQSVYGGSGGAVDSKSLGAGAAMQALKMLNSESGGSGSKSDFIGKAMAQASKMWEQKQQAGQASGDKQSAVNEAAKMAFKMYMKNNNGGGSFGTGGPGGGLLAFASKFM